MAMQQSATHGASLPTKPVSPPRPPASTATAATTVEKKRQLPLRPEDLLAHYEAQGLSPREASLRAISELEEILFRYASKEDRLAVDSPRKLEGAKTRLAILEMKLDSKPGCAESLAIGVASGTIVSVIPHVVGGLRSIWDSVGSATGGCPPSPTLLCN